MLDINLHNRNKLIIALKEDIIGPTSKKKGMVPLAQCDRIVLKSREELYKNRYYQQINGEEIIQRNNPSAYYVSGMIYPFNQIYEIEDEEFHKVQGDDDTQELTISKELVKELSIKSDEYCIGELSRTTENTEKDLMPQKNEYLPSSFGISFYCKLPKDSSLRFAFNAGRYTIHHIFTEDNTQKQAWWFRTPINKEILVATRELIENDNRMFSVTIEHSVIQDMKIQLNILSRRQKDGYLITASIANKSKLDGTSQAKLDEKTLFQCEFTVYADIGEILPYPNISLHSQDQDELSNTLLYRNMNTYALGHGCSAKWETTDIVKEVSTTFLPQYETESMTPDITDVLGREFSLSMLELGDTDNSVDEIYKVLNNVAESYEIWINSQSEKVDEVLDEQLRNTAELHIRRCYKCLVRMKKGMELLYDKDIFLAFKLANQAMALQQVNGIISRDGIHENKKIHFKIPYKVLKFKDKDIQSTGKGKWRAFQIAFILMAIDSTISKESLDRELVDLIWFPTGGGKTEAYLGLAAFSMFYRRIKNNADVGVDVLMRYTLRLLTADQFQRSSRLICSMEILRRENRAILGDTPFSIGIWLGSDTSPNKNQDAEIQLKELSGGKKSGKEFLLHNCPWCGAKLGYYSEQEKKGGYKQRYHHGYKMKNKELVIYCPDDQCDFHNELPVYIVDEIIYKRRPTFLIGTIDKFAMLTWTPQARSLFGLNMNGARIFSPPNLIIQDELHLISGSLGTITGLYESLIEELCTDKRDSKKIRAKIVCATATIRRYEEQICSLYARSNAQVFPSPGLEYNDSFFARPAKDKNGKNMPGRLYVGVYSPTVEKLSLQVKAYGTLLQVVQELKEEERDPFYTILSFYNSIREIGSAMTLIQTDIPNYFKQIRLKRNINNKEAWRWINSAKELTSRLNSGEVTDAIAQLKRVVGKYPIDICLASNIIEVGIDIDRLSLMTIVGQPKTTAQYIQVSGRVGRRWWERPGLVVTLYGSGKSRDKSHFEHFVEYHQKLYGKVEPTSVTPFSDPCLQKVLPGIIIGYLRQMLDEDIASSPKNIRKYVNEIKEFGNILIERVNIVEPRQKDSLTKEYTKFVNEYLINGQTIQKWACDKTDNEKAIMYMAGMHVTPEQYLFSQPIMTSMRNVDAQCKGKITDILDEYSLDEIFGEGEVFSL